MVEEWRRAPRWSMVWKRANFAEPKQQQAQAPPSRHNLVPQFRTSFPYPSIHQQSPFGTDSLIIPSFSTCRHVFSRTIRPPKLRCPPPPPPATPILGSVGRAQLHACIPATVSPRVEWTPYAPAQCHVVKKFGRLRPAIACITSMSAVIKWKDCGRKSQDFNGARRHLLLAITWDS